MTGKEDYNIFYNLSLWYEAAGQSNFITVTVEILCRVSIFSCFPLWFPCSTFADMHISVILKFFISGSGREVLTWR